MGFIVKGIKKVVGFVGKVVGKVVGFVGKLFGAKKKKPKDSGSRLNKSIDPECYRKIVFGKINAPLDVRYWEVWGSKGEKFDEVIALATHRLTSVKELYLEDDLAINAAGTVQSKFSGILTRSINLGNGAPALSVGAGAKWTSTATFDGCAHMVLKWVPDDEKLPNGIPNRYTQVVEGAPVYDPRRDSTVPGGSGTHRINDQSTWEYLPLDSNGVPIGRNNALQVLWYLIGWRIPKKDATGALTGELALVAGRGVDAEDINLSTFITAANDCEAAGYYTDIVLSTEDAHTANEDALTADGLIGRLIDPGGLWSYYANVDDTANIAVELTDDDILDSTSVKWNEHGPLSEQWTAVGGKFINPSSKTLYQEYPYPTVSDPVYEANLNGLKRRKTVDFEQVQDPLLAQVLARLSLNMAQFQGEFSAAFKYKALQAQAWSVVRYVSQRWGWTKLFRVYRYDLSTMQGIGMQLKEIDPSIWTAGTVVQPPEPALGIKYDPGQKVALTGLAAYPISEEASNGSAQAGLHIEWTAVPTVVRRVQVEYKVTGSTAWVAGGYHSREVTGTDLLPLLKVTNYTVRARTISIHEVPGDWVEITKATNDGSWTAWDEVAGRPLNLADLDEQAAQNIADAVSAIDKMTDDGMITVAEKGSLKRQHQALMARYHELMRRGPAVNVYPASENLATWSEDFGTDTGKAAVNLSVTENATTASNGEATADRITRANAVSAYMSIPVPAITNGKIITASIEVKKGSRGDYFGFRIQPTYGNHIDMRINLQTGVIVRKYAIGEGHLLDAWSEPLGDGWFRIYLTGYCVTGSTGSIVCGPSTEPLNAWEGVSSGPCDCYVCGLQVHEGMVRKPYVATTSSAVTQGSTSTIADKAVTALNEYLRELRAIQPAWNDTAAASAVIPGETVGPDPYDLMASGTAGWAVNNNATIAREQEWFVLTDIHTNGWGYIISSDPRAVNGKRHTVATEVKKATAPTEDMLLRLEYSGGTAARCDCAFNPYTGSAQVFAGSDPSTAVGALDAGDRWIVWVEGDADGVHTHFRPYVYPAQAQTAPVTSIRVRNVRMFPGSFEGRRRASLDEKATAFAKALDELATLTRERVQPLLTEFYEDFSAYKNTEELARNWNFTNIVNVGLVASSDTGGQALRCGDYTGTNDYQVFDPSDHAWVAYSPEDLYEVTFDIDIVKADASARFFLGVEGKDRNGNSLGNAHNYVAVYNLPMADYVGRRTYRGYMRGYTTGNAVQANSPDNPSPIKTGIVKIKPKVYLAYPTADPRDGVAYVHSVHLRKVTDATVTWTGAWSSTRTYYMNEGVTYGGRAFASKINGNLNKVPPSTATSNADWYLVADKGTDGSNGANGSDGVDGDDGAGAYNLVLTSPAMVALSPKDVRKNAGTDGAWDAQVYSLESYVGGAYASFQPRVVGRFFMFGLNTDPTADATYTSIDYAIYCHTTNVVVYEGGVHKGTVATSYSTSDVMAIHYDGKKVRYLINGVVVREVAAPANLRLYLDSSFNHIGAGASNIVFSAAGPAGTSPISVSAQPESLTFQANADGSIKTGQLPKAITNTALEGDTAVAVTSITGIVVSGCTASASGANVNINTVTASTGFVEYNVNASGQTVKKRVEFNTIKDAATQASATQQLTYYYGPTLPPGQITDSGVFTQIGENTTMSPSGAGKIKVSIDGWYKIPDAGPAHDTTATLQIKYQYRTSPSGAWIDIATVTGTPSRSYFNGGTGGYLNAGTIQNQTVKTGLTASEVYDMRILARMVNESGTTNVVRFESYNMAFFVGQEA